MFVIAAVAMLEISWKICVTNYGGKVKIDDAQSYDEGDGRSFQKYSGNSKNYEGGPSHGHFSRHLRHTLW